MGLSVKVLLWNRAAVDRGPFSFSTKHIKTKYYVQMYLTLTGGHLCKLIATEVQQSCSGNKKQEVTILEVKGRNANSSDDTLVI